MLVLIVLLFILALTSICVWVERKGSALLQDRIGANRAGSFAHTNSLLLKPFFFLWRLLGGLGLLNTLLCDLVKAIFKEDFIPQGRSNFIHSLAPFVALVPVFLAFAVVPLSPNFTLWGNSLHTQIASGLSTGALFFLAMGALAMHGVILAGWAGNNKYSMIGAMRAAAQMVSYLLVLSLSLLAVSLSYGTLDLYAMVEAQQGAWGFFRSPMMALACLLFFISAMAETRRVPFDLPEAESELVAGYCTEYSGLKFLLFWVAEFASIALLSLILVLIFFGGWHPLPYVELPTDTLSMALLGHFILMLKVLFFCVLQIVIRWTLPRFRFDQLMRLGWKVLMPLGVLNMILGAFFKLAL